jgi:cell wall-active antibiotic response 4TMS protein YvqF
VDDDRRRYRMTVGVKVGRQVSGRLIFGLIVMTLGVLWTLDNLGIVESDQVIRWWPVVVIAIGASKLVGFATRRHLVWGVTFVIAGFLLLAGQLGLSHFGFEDLWPLILIVLGIQLVTRAFRGPMSTQASADPMARLSTFAVWSGIERKPASQEFQGGDVSAVMGGARIDLRGAKPIPEGAVLDLFVWWGGVELTIPEHWKVVNETNVLMGGIEDKTKVAPPDGRDVLILRGLVVMGGIELKN